MKVYRKIKNQFRILRNRVFKTTDVYYTLMKNGYWIESKNVENKEYMYPYSFTLEDDTERITQYYITKTVSTTNYFLFKKTEEQVKLNFYYDVPNVIQLTGGFTINEDETIKEFVERTRIDKHMTRIKY